MDKLYQKVEGTGTVVAGVVEQGCVCYGDQLAIGPDEEGNFIDVRVDTIHVKRVNVRKVEAGMHATFAISHGSDPEAQVSSFVYFFAVRRLASGSDEQNGGRDIRHTNHLSAIGAQTRCSSYSQTMQLSQHHYIWF